jgi:hypothetical protein
MNRYEIKYRIGRRRASAIQEWLGCFMRPDANGEGGRPSYCVHSLYLDSPDWSLYRETTNGSFSRVKLRARIYSFDAQAPVFLEVKQRLGESMRKTRAVVPRSEAVRILQGAIPATKGEGRALDYFRALQDQRHAIPRIWVTYRRDALVDEHFPDLVRVTFDREVAYAEPAHNFDEPRHWCPLPETRNEIIMELKYSGYSPFWIAEMIRRFDLERAAMSKFKQAVEALRENGPAAPNFERSAPLTAPAWLLGRYAQ